MEQLKKVGIMGGTFNPIHQGHLLIAEQAREFCALDEVLFIPSGNPYMKNSGEILDGKIRIKMTALAIEDNPFFALSDMEVERGGNTYTCDTLRILKEKNPGVRYFFIVGADNLFYVENWKNPEDILEGCTLVAAARGEKDDLALKEKALELEEKYKAQIRILPDRKIDLSSSEIRKRLQNGESVRYMIPDKVFSFINKHELYRKQEV